MKGNTANAEDFKMMTRIVLVHVITFNRKRVGEVERLEKSTYLKKIQEVPQGEIENGLSKCETLLLMNLTLLHIRGKRGKKVPLLLTPKMVKYIDVVLAKRQVFGIPRDKKYVFGRTHSESYYRGSDALRDISQVCGADEPCRLTSTQLRKNIATVSHILNLKDRDLELLARHLGHSINVHREFYRLPHNTLQLAKVSKLLLQFEKGDIQTEKTLDDIRLEIDDENLYADSSSDSVINDSKQKDEIQTEILSGNGRHVSGNKGWVKRRTVKKVKISVREQWTDMENKAVRLFFEKHILRSKVPNKEECLKCLDKYPALKNRSWISLKSKIHNILSFNKRKNTTMTDT